MKTIFENVIKKGDYDLTDMVAKIDAYHIEGKLTAAEREELLNLARATPEAQYDCKSEIEKLWVAVKALQNGISTDNKENDVVAEWKQPDGAHDAYMKGDKVIYKGDVYESLIDNNVWSPDVYPNGWAVEEA